MKILIVDDNMTQSGLLKNLLKRRFDADVVQATTIAEAWAVVKTNELDCVVLDLSLPDSGIEATIETVKALPYPVFVYTGFDDPELRERVLNSGAEDFILKSTGNADIVERIAHLQYKRKGDKTLLTSAYRARHEEPRRIERLNDLKATVPRTVASILSVVMFTAGLFTGTWAIGRFFGQSTEGMRLHFDKLDQAIEEQHNANRRQDALLDELRDKMRQSSDDRTAIREQMKLQNDLILDWLRRIELKLDNTRK